MTNSKQTLFHSSFAELWNPLVFYSLASSNVSRQSKSDNIDTCTERKKSQPLSSTSSAWKLSRPNKSSETELDMSSITPRSRPLQEVEGGSLLN